MAYETPEDQPDTAPKLVEAWLEAIECAEKEEKDWIDQAERAVEAYRGDAKSSSRSFNIFHSNTETIVPALYNSTPVPDVRRRYNDDDKVAKAGADVIERAIGYSVDVYDFDGLMLAGVKDMAIVSRGMARVAYEPTFVGEGDDAYVADEQVCCKYVPWRSFRRGPARVWNDVPWIAFEHFLGKESIQKLNPEVAEEKFYLYSAEAKKDKDKDEGAPRFGKRARVWEIWDKDERKVHFISPDYAKGPIKTLDDPLGLQDFFPIPRPMQAVSTPDSLVPVTMLSIYSNLVDELNIVTRRIAALVKQLRPRAGYAGFSVDLKAIAEAGDGELVPFTNTEIFSASGGDLNKLLAWFPLDPIIKALVHLVAQRDAIKQTIYEVTGIADIMRGASNPNETLGAQQMKAQMGSMRVQRMQAEVQRFARDLFRLKTEVMCGKFAFETFEKITGLKFPSQEEKQAVEGLKAQYEQMAQQAQQQGQQPPPPPVTPEQMEEGKRVLESPTREEVEGIIRDNAIRAYNIDVETNSTIRGDVMRNQEQLGTFVQGLGMLTQAAGGLIEADPTFKAVAVELIGAFSRQQKLGKQVEDALDRWSEQAAKEAANPQERPNPEMEKLKLEQAKMQADQQAQQAKIHGDQQNAQIKLDSDMKAKEADMGMKRELAGLDMELQREKHMNEMQLQREKMHSELQLKRELGMMQAQQQAQQAEFGFGLEERKLRSSEEFEGRKLQSSEAIERERLAMSAKPQTQVQFGAEGEMAQVVDALSQAAQTMGEAAQAIAQSGQMTAEATNNLAQVMSADVVMMKDPMTGAKRARREMANGNVR
jgi:hypothetical protein